MSYQQIIELLTKMRLRPGHDHLFIEAHQARHVGYGTCENCGGSYPVGYDKKGLKVSAVSERFCPACFAERGTTECLRCNEPMPGHGERFCDECEDYIDSQ